MRVGFDESDTVDLVGKTPGNVTIVASRTLVTLACFAAGTAILTAHGERAVERLRVGDLLPCLAGDRLARVVWLGHRDIDCARHPHPARVWPVRIAAGAFGPGQPRRDLLLSPDHAVLIRDAGGQLLVPARLLVNGATVTRHPVGRITYWHVELDRHDGILAEGLACETYLDTGNRAAFAGEIGLALHPDFSAAIWDARACGRLTEGGPALGDLRSRLRRRAVALGHRPAGTPVPEVSVDGSAIAATGGIYALPPGARRLRLRSACHRPDRADPDSGDTRLLGIAVTAIDTDAGPLALDDARLGLGWHAPEDGLRWTGRDATIDVTGLSRIAFAVAPATGWEPAILDAAERR